MNLRRSCFIALTAVSLVASGCSSEDNTQRTTSGGSGGAGGGGEEPSFGGDRPVSVFVPSSYSAATPTPLVILLHGYGASGLLQSLYFGLEPLAEKYGFLYAHPDGTLDSSGKRFWNATDACCVFDGADVDDSAYLTGLIDEIGARYNVDPKRVFFLGHSNGGFMSHRMACDHADRIAAIASLAGANFSDSSKCQPNEPVSVLQIHGTADDTILYEGGVIGGASYPGAVQTVEQWATLNGCDLAPQDIAPALDLDEKLPGDETTVSRYAQNCQAGSVVELWTIQGGAHLPQLSPNFGPRVIEFLLAHPKP